MDIVRNFVNSSQRKEELKMNLARIATPKAMVTKMYDEEAKK